MKTGDHVLCVKQVFDDGSYQVVGEFPQVGHAYTVSRVICGLCCETGGLRSLIQLKESPALCLADPNIIAGFDPDYFRVEEPLQVDKELEADTLKLLEEARQLINL